MALITNVIMISLWLSVVAAGGISRPNTLPQIHLETDIFNYLVAVMKPDKKLIEFCWL